MKIPGPPAANSDFVQLSRMSEETGQTKKQVTKEVKQVPTEAVQLKEAVVKVGSLESTLAQKTKEVGKILDKKEEEYVRLQFERNSILSQYPNVSSRNKEIVKRIENMNNMLKKMIKSTPMDAALKLPFKSAPKSAAERKRESRMAKLIGKGTGN